MSRKHAITSALAGAIDDIGTARRGSFHHDRCCSRRSKCFYVSMRYRGLVLSLCAAFMPCVAAAAISESATGWARQGRALFARCEFSGAVRAFKRAADTQPDNAEVRFWLGRSYERMAETSAPLIAPRHAHKAERSLEQALQLDPTNRKYQLELFGLYVDTPEWFSRAPQRASALLERMSTTPEEYATLHGRLAEARQNSRGLDSSVERAILLPSRILGGIVR